MSVLVGHVHDGFHAGLYYHFRALIAREQGDVYRAVFNVARIFV